MHITTYMYPKSIACVTSPFAAMPGGAGILTLTTFSVLAFKVRGWRNPVEIILFEISNSMKPYASVFQAYTSKLRPAIGLFEPGELDEVSNRIPPTFSVLAFTFSYAVNYYISYIVLYLL